MSTATVTDHGIEEIQKRVKKWPFDNPEWGFNPGLMRLWEALSIMPGIDPYRAWINDDGKPSIVFAAHSWVSLDHIALMCRPSCCGLQGWKVTVHSRSIQGYRPHFILEGPDQYELNKLTASFLEYAQVLEWKIDEEDVGNVDSRFYRTSKIEEKEIVENMKRDKDHAKKVMKKNGAPSNMDID